MCDTNQAKWRLWIIDDFARVSLGLLLPRETCNRAALTGSRGTSRIAGTIFTWSWGHTVLPDCFTRLVGRYNTPTHMASFWRCRQSFPRFCFFITVYGLLRSFGQVVIAPCRSCSTNPPDHQVKCNSGLPYQTCKTNMESQSPLKKSCMEELTCSDLIEIGAYAPFFGSTIFFKDVYHIPHWLYIDPCFWTVVDYRPDH